MKKIVILLILITLIGCTDEKQEEIIVEPEKSSIEILISGENFDTFHSYAISFSSINLTQEEIISEISTPSDMIELKNLNDAAYSFLKIPAEKNKASLQLNVKEIIAYIDDVRQNISQSNFAADIDINNTKLLITIYPNSSTNKILTEEIQTKELSELTPIGKGKKKVIEKVVMPSGPTTYEITLTKGKADPNELTIEKRDKVIWNNEGKTSHRIYVRKPYNYFRSDLLKPGDKFEFTFNEKGEFAYTSAAYASYMFPKIIVK